MRRSPSILSNLPPRGSYWNIRSPKGDSVWFWGWVFFYNTMQKLSNLARKNGLSESLALRASQWNLDQCEVLTACIFDIDAGIVSGGNWRKRKLLSVRPSARVHLSYLASHSVKLSTCDPQSREGCIQCAGSDFPALAWTLSICPPPVPKGHMFCLKPTKCSTGDWITQRKKLLSNASCLVIRYSLVLAENSLRFIMCLEIS